MPSPSLTALSKTDFVHLLQQSGSRTISLETLEAAIQAGAPTNPDGTLNFLVFTAWLIKESENGD